MTIHRINQWARREPDKAALIHNDRRIGYLELARLIEATRRRLATEIPPPGSLAVIVTSSLLSAWVLDTAARALGLTTMAVASLPRARELNLKDIACVILADDEQGFLSEAAALPGVRHILVPAATIKQAEGLEPTAALVDGGPPGDHFLYTSGTTGSYKKVKLEGAIEDRRNQLRAQVAEFDAASVFHGLDFGLWTGIGFKSATAVWLCGGCVVIDQTAERYANFTRYGPTYAQTLAESLKGLVDAAGPDAMPSDKLLLRSGGGFTALDVAEKAISRVAKRLVVGFSATELTATAIRQQFQTAEDLVWLTPLEHRLIQIVDEDGEETPVGVDGELRIQLTELDSTAYLDDPEATARAFRDGFFYPGDMAVRREDGRIRILGRAADVLNVRGRKVAVAPIERALQEGLGVEEVCLFLGMAADGVEELAVAVRTGQPLDEGEVLRRLGPSNIFERVRVVVLPEFPRTQAGSAKTKRTELRRIVFPT